jgi:uncharacterized protein YxjI
MQSDLFADANTIVIHQTKGPGAILTGVERCNRFSIDFGNQAGMLLAEEQVDGWTRFFLGSLRAYALVIQQSAGNPVLRMRSAFRFIHREMTVTSADSQPLGTVRGRFAFLQTRYDVFDARGTHLFDIARGLVKGMTFTVRRGETAVAIIVKRARFLNPRPLERAQRYELDFADVHSPVERALLLGALFLIDFQHFEASGED